MLQCKNCGSPVIIPRKVSDTVLVHISESVIGVQILCNCGCNNQICYGNSYVEAAGILRGNNWIDL